MKKFYFLIGGLLLSMGTMAQLTNGGLENWTSGDPDGWETQDPLIDLLLTQLGSSGLTVQVGGVDVTESVTESTTDPLEGNSNAKIESFVIAGSPVPDIPDGVYGNMIQQSVETTTKYAGVAFAYKADVQGADAVGVFVNATNNGNNVAQGYKMYTASESAWVRDTVYLSFTAEPDTIQIVFASSFGTVISAPSAPTTGVEGTMMEVDDVQFLAAPVYADGASNVLATDISDNHNGSDLQVTFDAAADENTVSEYRIIVMEAGLGLLDWSVVPAPIYGAVTPDGSTSYTHVFDASSVYLADDGGNNVVPTAIVENVEMDVYVLSVADGTNATVNQIAGPSTITLESTLGITTETVQNAIVYPNPAQNQVNVITGFDNGSVVINSVTGQVVANGTIVNGDSKIDVSNLNNGIYIYTIRNEEGAVVKTNKLVIR